MSMDEDLRKLREYQKKREEEYLMMKGALEVLKTMKLNPFGKAVFALAEMMTNGFRTMDVNYGNAIEQQIRINHRVSTLAKKVEELENNILQLRETLDKLYHAK